MGILRITLDSWQDLGAATTPPGEQPGDALTGRIYCAASVTGSVIDPDGGLHQLANESIADVSAPRQHDLLDPTDCQPTDWGWTVTLTTPTSRRSAVAVLSPDNIAAVVPVDGVRTMRLEDWVGLGDVLPTGTVTAGAILAPELAAFAAEMEG